MRWSRSSSICSRDNGSPQPDRIANMTAVMQRRRATRMNAVLAVLDDTPLSLLLRIIPGDAEWER